MDDQTRRHQPTGHTGLAFLLLLGSSSCTTPNPGGGGTETDSGPTDGGPSSSGVADNGNTGSGNTGSGTAASSGTETTGNPTGGTNPSGTTTEGTDTDGTGSAGPTLEELLANIDASGNLDERSARAFPGATGFGQHSSGGRGGPVFCVNTLQDVNVDGDGLISYREAVEGLNEAAESPRIVTFCVAGEIFTGTEPVRLHNSGGVTIACQTAPSPGVVMTGYRALDLDNDADNIIMRYCDMKPRDTLNPELNTGQRGITVGGGSGIAPDNLIFDHMSIMWSTDDSFVVYVGIDPGTLTPGNVTLMQSLVGEGDTTCNRSDNECGNQSTNPTFDYRFPNHSTGPAIASLNGTQIRGISHIANVMGNTAARNPQVRGAFGEVANNFVFNMFGDGTRASMSAGVGTSNTLYIENNTYKRGPDSVLARIDDHLIYSDGQYVVNGNRLIEEDGTIRDDYIGNGTTRADTLSHEREYLDGDNLLNIECVGASRPHRDSADSRIVAEANGVGTDPVLESAEIGIGPRVPPLAGANGPCTMGLRCFFEPTTDDQGQRDYSDYAAEASHAEDYDTDGDGIEDAWEQLVIDADPDDRLTSLESIDHTTDADNDGYLDVEEWLNTLARCQ